MKTILSASVRRIILSACVITLLAAGGCRSSRKAVTKTSVPDVPSVPAVVETPQQVRNTLAIQFDRLASSYGNWTDVQMPVKADITSPMKLSLSGRATLVRDKAVYLSIRLLGMEMGALYADNDSAFITIRLNKLMYAESMDKFTKTFGLTLGDLQDALLGRAFYPGQGTLKSSDTKLFTIPDEEMPSSGDSYSWILKPRKATKGGEWFFRILSPTGDSGAPCVESLEIVPSASASAICRYSGPVISPDGIFASNAEVNATLGKRNLRATLRWTFSDAKWDTGTKVNFSKPSGYRRVTTEEVIKILKSL